MGAKFLLSYVFRIVTFLTYVITVQCQSNTLNYCLRNSENPSLKECFGKQAISFLQTVESAANFSLVSGVTTGKSDVAVSRIVPNLFDQDPLDFRGILENAGAIFSQRNLQWELGNVYPGLCMRIGPSADSNSMLEFVIDPSQEVDERVYLGEEPSTARILTQQYLLPLLLGLKFNLATITPIILGAIIILCKKAALLAKLAIFLSGIFGVGGAFSLGSLFSGNRFQNSPHVQVKPSYGFSGGFPEHAHHIDSGYYGRKDRKTSFENNPLPDLVPDKFYDYERNALLQTRSAKVHDSYSEPFDENIPHSNTHRSFVWQTM